MGFTPLHVLSLALPALSALPHRRSTSSAAFLSISTWAIRHQLIVGLAQFGSQAAQSRSSPSHDWAFAAACALLIALELAPRHGRPEAHRAAWRMPQTAQEPRPKTRRRTGANLGSCYQSTRGRSRCTQEKAICKQAWGPSGHPKGCSRCSA